MSARGRHRRPRARRISRISLMLTAGGAGVALPLVAAGQANAAPAVAPAAAFGSGPVVSAAAPQAAAPQAFVQTAAPSTVAEESGSYTVVSGDTLFGIATAQEVEGGWQGLYESNREVIGGNPDLIHPGQELSLDGQAVLPRQQAAPKAEHKAKPKHAKPKAESKPAPKAEPKAEQQEKPAASAQSSAQSSAGSAAAPAAPAAPAATGFTAPVAASPSTAYGATGSLWSSGYHTGVDFSAPAGAQVRAVTNGTVVSAGWGGAYGNEVVIRHHDGRYSQYAHLSAISVAAGQSVSAGQQIGLVGSTGNSTGPHLHFEVRTGSGYGSDIDPLAYLRANGVSI